MLAESASWLFRVAPYLIFAATWVAAALVPTFATGLIFNWAVDLIAIVALLGSARFFLALAGMDVGTSFGGIGSSREMMIASLAEPAMLMMVFTLALFAGTTQLSSIADFVLDPRSRPARLAGPGAGGADHGGAGRERPHPDRQPDHASRADHGPRGDGARIFGPAPRADRVAAALKLTMYLSLIACIFFPYGMAQGAAAGLPALLQGGVAYLAKLGAPGRALVVFEVSIAKMRVFRVGEFLGGALMLGFLGTLLLFVSRAM